ncbi:MAG TPA: universal stress protein [Solirubrobacteraceae bacterium]|jgi:nucleotide-binding universal stress UspA family protein
MAKQASIVVSYDGTHNEDDAVALGRLFAQAGAEISLTYVRHSAEVEAGREALAEHEAEELLRRGAALLGGHEVGRHVVTDRSTPEGLRRLAERVNANAVVFCSDSHTAKGHIAIGNSARRLIEGGPLAVAIAPAGFATQDARLQLIGVGGDREDPSARVTAESLAAAVGASVSALADESADLLVIGSREEVEAGRVGLSAAAENLIEGLARCPVIVMPRGVELSFADAPSLSSAPNGSGGEGGGIPVAA